MKTFKNSYMAAESMMEIEPSISGELFHITHVTGRGEKSFKFSNTDAPALALAILEAAGFEAKDFAESDDAEMAVAHLTSHVGMQRAKAAEAKEQAELEAEALELANSAVLVVGNPPYPSIGHMSDTSLRKWLAVARKAREMAKEAHNA